MSVASSPKTTTKSFNNTTTNQINTMNLNPTNFAAFSSTSVDFEQLIEGNEQAFGVLKLCVNKFPITSTPLSISLMIDNSGSMSFKCPDGETQQAHVNFAADKVLRYLQNHGVDAHVTVSSFDDNMRVIVEPQQLTQDNIEDISKKIYKIIPEGGTNIYSVLDQEANWSQEDGSIKKRISFIFTDGHPTVGATTSIEELIGKAQLTIPQDTTIVTIGCGVNHSSQLLKGIANRKRGAYKFIGNIEEISFACGEILDEILNNVVEDCEIIAVNGEIWDWKKNDWVDKISTRNIVGECDKTYHVRSTNPPCFRALFTGVTVESRLTYEHVIEEIHENVDVRKHKYRQETLELLHETNEKYKENMLNGNTKTAKELKHKLAEFIVKLKAFMDENGFREDVFMKMLCDDIFVCYNAIGTPHGYMYTQSRQNSQATQGIHTNTCEQQPLPPPGRFMRRGNIRYIPIPLCSRQVSQSIQLMREDFEAFDYLDEALGEQNSPISSRPSGFQTCAMQPIDVRDEDLDEDENLGEVLDEDEDFPPPSAMTRHVSMSSYISPYSNEKTMSVIREVSIGSSYIPEEEEEEDKMP